VDEVKRSFEEKCAFLGFVKCEFKSGIGDPCERCHKDLVQLYYRRTDNWVEEYFCEYCVNSFYNAVVEELAFVEKQFNS